MTITPTTSTPDFGFDFYAPLGDGGTGHLFVTLPTGLGLTIDSLVGVPVRSQYVAQLLDCSTPDMGDIPGEPLRVVLSIFRDAAGAIIALNGEGMLNPDGSVDLGQEILPELKFRWVSTPTEDCLYRSEALELTVVATGEKVLGHWNRRAHVTLGKYGYLFLVTSELGPLTGCGEYLSWILIRDGFLHAVRDGG